MWLRRQDELNEVRPTERFSTAIRLLSGRAAMERKISRQLEETQPLAVPSSPADAEAPSEAESELGAGPDETVADGTGAEDFFAPSAAPTVPAVPAASAAASRQRAALLARRRRMVVILFAAFTVGMVFAAVGGVALLWIPAVPAVLFSLYIAQMRRQEHRRYEVKLDRRRAAEAAQRVRQQAAARREAATAAAAAVSVAVETAQAARTTAGTGALGDGVGATRPPAPERAERTEPWADHDVPERGGVATPSTARREDGWEPVPVPLPTYVTAPVAPRATLGLDLSAPDTHSSARGRQARPNPQTGQTPVTPPRRPAPKPTTPLFDQFADDTPRAANE